MYTRMYSVNLILVYRCMPIGKSNLGAFQRPNEPGLDSHFQRPNDPGLESPIQRPNEPGLDSPFQRPSHAQQHHLSASPTSDISGFLKRAGMDSPDARGSTLGASTAPALSFEEQKQQTDKELLEISKRAELRQAQAHKVEMDKAKASLSDI